LPDGRRDPSVGCWPWHIGQILIGVFSGPVGWVALAVAAGVAIYAFRDQIGQAFQAIGGMLQAGAAGFKSMFIDPVVAGFTAVVQFVNTNFVQPVQASITGLVEMIGNTFKKCNASNHQPISSCISNRARHRKQYLEWYWQCCWWRGAGN
jgi:hypothetical protein